MYSCPGGAFQTCRTEPLQEERGPQVQPHNGERPKACGTSKKLLQAAFLNAAISDFGGVWLGHRKESGWRIMDEKRVKSCSVLSKSSCTLLRQWQHHQVPKTAFPSALLDPPVLPAPLKGKGTSFPLEKWVLRCMCSAFGLKLCLTHWRRKILPFAFLGQISGRLTISWCLEKQQETGGVTPAPGKYHTSVRWAKWLTDALPNTPNLLFPCAHPHGSRKQTSRTWKEDLLSYLIVF